MIRSWANSASRKLWENEKPNRYRGLDFDAAVDLLLALNVARTPTDLGALSSVGLHRLKGEIREAEGELEAAQRRPVSSDGR